MSSSQPQGQLELFDLAHQPQAKPRSPSLGRFLVTLRYDQAVLCGIAGLIGFTVIFACGVERGKQLSRTERALITREELARPAAAPTPVAPPTTVAAAPVGEASTPKKTASPAPAATKSIPMVVPSTSVKKKEPSKLAATKDGRRYAVQAASYRQAPLAKRELDRLLSSGERAFLVMKNGYTTVYLGPFPSKTHASEKLTTVRQRYQGCFIRTL